MTDSKQGQDRNDHNDHNDHQVAQHQDSGAQRQDAAFDRVAPPDATPKGDGGPMPAAPGAGGRRC